MRPFVVLERLTMAERFEQLSQQGRSGLPEQRIRHKIDVDGDGRAS